jgi:flagellar assembly factor FliW
MQDNTIQTSRFGAVHVEPHDVIEFPRGILGMEHLREWVLFADAQNAQLGWLQSIQQPEVALAVVSPRRFVPEYQVRVARRELAPLKLETADDAHVLAIVSQNNRYITLNLKAPLVINLPHRVGCQVVAKGNQPIQHELSYRTAPLKQSA